MTTLLGILLASAIGADFTDEPVLRERVDLIELNHFIDNSGRHVFDQLIFYDWSARHSRYHVRAWRLIKSSSQFPTRHWDPPGYRCVWHDDGVLREIWAASFRETWSQQDPERVNRELFPEDRRRELKRPRPPRRRGDRETE